MFSYRQRPNFVLVRIACREIYTHITNWNIETCWAAWLNEEKILKHQKISFKETSTSCYFSLELLPENVCYVIIHTHPGGSRPSDTDKKATFGEKCVAAAVLTEEGSIYDLSIYESFDHLFRDPNPRDEQHLKNLITQL